MLHSVIAVSTSRDIQQDARRLLAEQELTPFSARSLLLSFLLGTHPPDVPAARLVDFGDLFGLRAGTIRTALSRMTATGDVEANDGRYRLAGRLLDRQREFVRGQQRPVGEWNGDWWTVLVTADARSVAERRRFRSAMEGALLGELRPDTWMRPANSDAPGEVAAAFGGSGIVATRGPLAVGDDASLAAQLWDVSSIEATSARIVDVLAPLGADLAATEVGGDDRAALLPVTFEVSAVAVRHLRTEPQLPSELADSSASQALRSTYAEVTALFRSALDEHLRHHASV